MQNANNYLMALQQLCQKITQDKQLTACENLPNTCYYTFFCVPKIGGVPLAIGIAKSKKLAQHVAAKRALKLLGEHMPEWLI